MKLKHMHPKFLKITLCWDDALLVGGQGNRLVFPLVLRVNYL